MKKFLSIFIMLFMITSSFEPLIASTTAQLQAQLEQAREEKERFAMGFAEKAQRLHIAQAELATATNKYKKFFKHGKEAFEEGKKVFEKYKDARVKIGKLEETIESLRTSSASSANSFVEKIQENSNLHRQIEELKAQITIAEAARNTLQEQVDTKRVVIKSRMRESAEETKPVIHIFTCLECTKRDARTNYANPELSRSIDMSESVGILPPSIDASQLGKRSSAASQGNQSSSAKKRSGSHDLDPTRKL